MKTYLKKNKALFWLPLAAIPFLILIFYVLGGGKGIAPNKSQSELSSPGANYNIPEAEKSIEIMDKMEAYQQQAWLNDKLNQNTWSPDSNLSLNKGPGDSTSIELAVLAQQNHQLPENLLAHIKQKEQELRKELEEPQEQAKRKPTSKKRLTEYKPIVEKQPQPASGMEELNKIFVENAQLKRQNDSLKFDLERKQKHLKQIQVQNASFSLDKKQGSGFEKDETAGKLIKAEVYETTTVLDGNRVKLRLLEDAWLNDKEIAQNSFIYGTCKIKNERLLIEVTQMPREDDFVPVKLSVHDLDGLPGLYVPDNVARKVTQGVGAGTNTSSMFGVSNNPLSYAGIQAADRTAQTLLKRVRLKKVTVKKNTLVYLSNDKN